MDTASKTQTTAVDAFPKQDLLMEPHQTKNLAFTNDKQNPTVLDNKDNDKMADKCLLLETSEIGSTNNVSEAIANKCLTSSVHTNEQDLQEDSNNGLDKDEIKVGKNVLTIGNEDEKKKENFTPIVLKTTAKGEEEKEETAKTDSEMKAAEVLEIKYDENIKSLNDHANTDTINNVQTEPKENALNDKQTVEKKEVCEPMSVETNEMLTEQHMDVDNEDQQTMEVESKHQSPTLDDVEMEAEEHSSKNTSNEVTEVEAKNDIDLCTGIAKKNLTKVSKNSEDIVDISSSEDEIHDNNSAIIDGKQNNATATIKSPEKTTNLEFTEHNRKVTTELTTKTIPDSTCINKHLALIKEGVGKTIDPDSICIQNSKLPSKTSNIEDDIISNKIESKKEFDQSVPIQCYLDARNKTNGITDGSTEEGNSLNINSVDQCDLKASEITSIFDNTMISKKNHIYKVNISYDVKDVKFLSIERISKNQMPNSSNGGGPVSNITITNKTTDCQLSEKQHNFENVESLCEFMINEFTKIKESIQTESGHKDKFITPEYKPNQKPINQGAETPSSTKSKRSRKRSITDLDEDSPKAKYVRRDSKITPHKDIDEKTATVKVLKRDLKETSKKKTEDEIKKPCVLAKWIDKKFYAGRVVGEKLGKFVIRFEDGAQKILPKESIVFGDDDTLPLLDHSVFAHVDDDYESGTVSAVENIDNIIVYTVNTPSKTVKVTASDLYIQSDQAKIIQKLNGEKFGEPFDEPSRSSRTKRQQASPISPEAGYSGGIGKRSKRQKRKPPKEVICFDSSTDDEDDSPQSKPFAKSAILSPVRGGIELIEGVQPELQKNYYDSELSKMEFISDYEKYQPECNVNDLLGPMPTVKTIFRGKCFLLTCTVGLKPHRFASEENGYDAKFRQFSSVPFIKNYLQKQIEAAGGKVYQYFEDLPKRKYRQCKLIAPRPCLTAKYVQCLAANIPALSHEWIVDSCRQNKAAVMKNYCLPAGWSVLGEKFVKWKTGKSSDERLHSNPFEKSFILIAGIQDEFIQFWSRVCKLAGGHIRYIKSINDVTPTTKGYMVAESDFSTQIRSKAAFFGIPIISTFWVVQSLILGYMVPPNCHAKLGEIYQDDEI